MGAIFSQGLKSIFGSLFYVSASTYITEIQGAKNLHTKRGKMYALRLYWPLLVRKVPHICLKIV